MPQKFQTGQTGGPGGLEGQSGTSTPSASKDTSEMPTSRRQSPASTTNESVSTALPKMTDPPHNTQNHQLSSPSSPSLPPSEKLSLNGVHQQPYSTKDTGSGTGPSPYGTRSRNRTGASRPNYAEDKDLDMEIFDGSSGKRDDDSKKATRQAASANSSSQGAAQTTTAPRTSNGSSRKPLPTEASQHHHGAGANSKDSKELSSTTNSTSTVAANSTTATSTPAAAASTQQPTRKRKAATSQAATPAASQVQLSSNGHTSTALQKKIPAILHDGRGYSETNMLTFENCEAKPNKDGKMVADDGTVLGVNGECLQYCLLLITCRVTTMVVLFCGLQSPSSFLEVAAPSFFRDFSNMGVQITSTWSVSHLASHTTWAASWNSSIPKMTQVYRLMLYVSIGFIVPRILGARCRTRDMSLPRCIRTSVL